MHILFNLLQKEWSVYALTFLQSQSWFTNALKIRLVPSQLVRSSTATVPGMVGLYCNILSPDNQR